MDRLEKFINENREFFDSEEPETGHFNRFEQKIEQKIPQEKRGPFTRSLVLKIAATIILIFTVSLFLFDFNVFRSDRENLTRSEFTGEIREAINYYGITAEDQMGEFNKLACCGQDTKKLQHIAVTELNALDESTRELELIHRKNPGDERIRSAVIRNQQMKETILKNMIQKIQIVK